MQRAWGLERVRGTLKIAAFRFLGLDGVLLCNPITDLVAVIVTSILLAASSRGCADRQPRAR